MEMKKKIAELLSAVRNQVPLIHNITNYVTVNDVANVVLAIGASPIMADDIGEAADITSISSALVINIGTLNTRTIESMIAAGKKANDLGIPVILDPVGAGASSLRNQATERIMKEVRISILRGNLSEISFIAGLKVSTKGVDTSAADGKNDAQAVAQTVANRYGCIAAITGAIDVISDGTEKIKIANGHPMLSKVTGTGCMTSALVGAFAGAGSDYLSAAVAGIASMGIAGETAFQTVGTLGTGSFHVAIIDALSRLTAQELEKRVKIVE